MIPGQATPAQKEASLRHSAYYASLLETLNDLFGRGSNSLLNALARFDQEWRNIEVGQLRAVELADFDEEAAQLCIKYGRYSSDFFSLRGHPREQLDWCEKARCAAQRLSDSDSEAFIDLVLGNAYRVLGEADLSAACYKRVIAASGPANKKVVEGAALQGLGNLWRGLGRIGRR